jgi:hypothetical protein
MGDKPDPIASVGGDTPHPAWSMDLSSMAFEHRCRVCSLSMWNMPLFLKIHSMVIVDGISKQAATKWVGKEIEEWNKNNPDQKKQTMSDAAVANHFKHHVPAPLAINAQVKKSLTLHDKGQVPFPPQVQKALESMNETVETKNLNELQKFHSLVDKVAERFEQLDKQIGSKTLTVENVAMFRALAELLGKLRKDSMTMRNQERMLTSAVTSALDTYSIGALQGVLKSFEILFQDYRKHFVDPAVADQFAIKLRSELAHNMIASAKVALDAIRQQLKTS